MSILEKKAIQAFREMWKLWSKPSKQTSSKALSFFAHEFHGFGSATHEVWRGKSELEQFFHRSIEQVPDGFSVQEKWLESRYLGDNFVALWGEILVTIMQDNRTVSIGPIRTSAIFRETNGKLEMVQFHNSLPRITEQFETWPGTGQPKQYEEVSILFTAFVGFAHIVATTHAQKIIEELNEIFSYFDAIIKSNGLEKLKTIGDSYMAVGGLYDKDSGQSVAAVQAAKEMLAFLETRNQQSDWQWDMRIGINTGPVIGGILGQDKLTFDLWGKTVNDARHIEKAGAMNRVTISSHTHSLVKDIFDCTYRGNIATKDKGGMNVYLVI